MLSRSNLFETFSASAPSKTMPQIVPKGKAPGVDFCGADKHYYIIRSDLGCYMKSSSFNEGNDLEVFSLHNSCLGGDHYLAHQDDFFYIIKEDHYRRVTDMQEGKGAVVYSLHPNCQGGDHYLSAFGHFYIIFQEKGIYRKVTDLNTDGDAVEYTLHPDCKNGLYYWGCKNYYYFVKPHDEWGIQYFKCTNFHENIGAVTYSFHGSVVPFLPGGLAITHGVSFGEWEAIKTISNDSNSPITLNKKITKKMGFNIGKMDSVEKHWKISMGSPYRNGALTEAISKFQFNLSGEHGGTSVQTEQEDWNEVRETEESINETIQPKSQLYIWQYKLGFGKEPVMFCRDIKFTKDPTPPTTVPLQSSSKPLLRMLKMKR